MPVPAMYACAYADSTAARLVAAIQISALMAPDCHKDSARLAAS